MNQDDFRRWLDAYGLAWVDRDPDAAAALFSENAVYQETPFQPALVGRAEIRRYWAQVPESQEDIQFGCKVLAITGDMGIAHWWASFTRTASGALVSLNGILTADFNENGLCETFQEWWHRQETQP